MFHSLPTIRIPVEKPRSIKHKALDLKPLLQGIVDPFLYNPRKAVANKVCLFRSATARLLILHH